MAISLMQKIRLGLRGWMRRHEGSADARNADFLKRNATWAAPPPAAAQAVAANAQSKIDLEGLQVAYLDDSGQIEHYLDTASGEVIDIPSAQGAAVKLARENPGLRRVPARSEASDAEDRAAFVEAMDPAKLREELRRALGMPDAAREFRQVLARDRSAERAWYNFKNDRAIAVIEKWLEEEE